MGSAEAAVAGWVVGESARTAVASQPGEEVGFGAAAGSEAEGSAGAEAEAAEPEAEPGVEAKRI